ATAIAAAWAADATVAVAVLVSTLSTPPTSLITRDSTSPVFVRVKNASERRWRWPYTATRSSCMTCWPMIVASWPVQTASALVASARSEEHTSELQSRGHLVCRLLLEKKNQWQGLAV